MTPEEICNELTDIDHRDLAQTYRKIYAARRPHKVMPLSDELAVKLLTHSVRVAIPVVSHTRPPAGQLRKKLTWTKVPIENLKVIEI